MSYLADKNIILIKVTGVCDASSTVPIIEVVQAKAERHGCTNWLLDMREAIRCLDNLDYYRRPELYRNLNVSTAVRKAVVFPDIGEQERFYEAVCRNKGFNISVFSDIDAAMGWLASAAEHGSDKIEGTVSQT